MSIGMVANLFPDKVFILFSYCSPFGLTLLKHIETSAFPERQILCEFHLENSVVPMDFCGFVVMTYIQDRDQMHGGDVCVCVRPRVSVI